MNVLDLPWYVILAGWLFRRLTKPAYVSSFTSPLEAWEAKRNAIDSIILYRIYSINSPSLWLFNIVDRYKYRQYDAYQKLRDMGITSMGAVKFKKGDNE